MNNDNAMEHLVNSQHGVYAWDILLNNFEIYVNDNKPHEIKDWLMNNSDIMEGATIKTLFHPDNEHWCDNLDYLNNGSFFLTVMDKNGTHWTIDQFDGDLYAINPLALQKALLHHLSQLVSG